MDQVLTLNLEKIINRCIQKNFNDGENIGKSFVVNNIKSYLAVWQGFTKWVKQQISLDKTVKIPNFGGVSFIQDPDTMDRIVIIQFSEGFLKLANLSFINDMSDFTYPSIKINMLAIAQIVGIEQQNVSLIISNIFQEITQIIIQNPQVNLDLGFFGKIRTDDGNLTLLPQKPKERQSISSQTLRQTVQGLEKPRNLPKLGSQQELEDKLNQSLKQQDFQEEQLIAEKLALYQNQKRDSNGFNPQQQRYSAQPNRISGPGFRPQPGNKKKQNFDMDQQRGQRSVTYQQGDNFVKTISSKRGFPNQQSPVRNFQKPKSSKIDSDMLGAGTDPMAREGEFSLLANRAENLIKANFVKPGHMEIRFPPVLDKFSRTLATPVSEMKYNLNPCGRIGSNFTPSAKLFYLDQKDKIVKTAKETNIISFQANNKYLQVPATQEEEILHQINKEYNREYHNPQLEKKIEAKQICYDRYKKYIEKHIQRDHIAPIRQYWINDILDLIPVNIPFLTKDFIEMSIDSMLQEIGEYYYNSIRKSILDYVLKNEDEKLRLGIVEILRPIKDYGSNIYGGIEPDTDWRNSVIYAREEMYDKLVICNDATLEIQTMWHEINKVEFQLLGLPQKGEQGISIQQFMEIQTEKIYSTKEGIANQYTKEIQDIYKRVLIELEDAENYAQQFFESTSILLSNLLRTHVTDNIKEYRKFFERFDQEEQRPPQLIIEQDIENYLESQIEDIFLTIELEDDGHGYITFKDSLEQVNNDLIRVLDELVRITHSILRPEHSLAKIDKQYLLEMPVDDETYIESKEYINEVVTNNLINVEKALEIYNEYAYILVEDKIVKEFISTKPDRKAYTQLIQKYYDLFEEVKNNCPFFIRMNMVLVDGIEIKSQLLQAITNLINQLQEDGINTYIVKLNQELSKEISSMLEKISKNVDSTKTLVDLESQIDQIRNVEEKNLTDKYKEICSWLQFLLTLQRQTSQEEINAIYMTSKQIFQMMDKVEEEDDRLKIERERSEADLKERKIKFNKEIEIFLQDIEQLDQFQTKFFAKDTNAKIRGYNERLNEMLQTRAQINEDEMLLGWEQTEFPNLEQGQNQLKPYEELWGLVENYDTYHTQWTKENIFKLDPEFIEKETKFMFQTAMKLNFFFNADSKDDHKKSKQALAKKQGPKKLVKEVLEQIKSFQQHVPLVRCLCNPGLKSRHWESISDEVGFTISSEKEQNLNNLIHLEIDKHQAVLEDISENASKEFAIEKILQKMLQDWEPVIVELKPWKDTGTHIVQGSSIEEMQQILDDQMVKTQTMKGSPYAKTFEKQIHDWEKWLQFTSQFCERLVRVQGTWIYLEPIFSSPDILKRLPHEGKKFNDVDEAWKNLMRYILKNPQVLTFTKKFDILQTLIECQANLDVVNKGLNAYLEGKRAGFPRFYFLSNDELLEILSETKDPLKVQPHLKKCFEGIQKLEFDSDKQVLGMYSSEGEHVEFLQSISTVAAQGNVEEWLQQTEECMVQAVHHVIGQAYEEYVQMKRDEWVLNRCGMSVLCMSMTYWTSETEQAIDKGYEGVQEHLSYLNQCINDIVQIVRSDIPKLDRCTIEALIVLDVHNKDVVAQLEEQKIEKIQDFMWQSQLRYYWNNQETVVKIINAIVDYNYEYLGNSSRLVITPLTDRCYRTLCGAVHLNYGGAPEGPAGTGKTETTKDLAKALARQCVVFNCSDGLDYKAMAKFFKGLASSGAWSCFDEFNRIDLEVLSVIAQQILTIQLARAKKLKRFLFEDSDIPLKPTCNVFITMNPGYAGRSELPDNLKALFRTVAMMVPDYALIAEIVLYSFGFSDARRLARKIVTTYTLCSEQLSSQDHYDYGMRAVKSVLTAAGNLKRKFQQEDESVLMLRAINEVNLAKFLAYDIPLFKGITSDLFQKVVLPEIDYKDMYQAIDDSLNEVNLQNVGYFQEKTIQLYEMILVRHGLMVVGQPFSGKSSILKILQSSLNKLKEREQMNENATQMTIINPKSIPMKYLYGFNDEVSQDWTDGVLAVKFRNYSKAEDPDRKWLVFDGPVDAIWIENMNTVLDDNKKLCLMSGEIIQMANTMSLIFEPMDLAAASPATVSRNGMIFMEPQLMGWRPIYNSWKNTLPESLGEEEINELDACFDIMIDPGLDFIRHNCQQISPSQDQNLIQALLRILGKLLDDYDDPKFKKQFKEVKQVYLDVSNKFVFSYVWSLGACLSTESRKPFDLFTKKLANGDIKLDENIKKKKISLPERGQLFEYKLEDIDRPDGTRCKDWVKWLDTITPEQIPAKAQVQQILVETSDTIRYSYLLQMHIQLEIPILFCGPTGTGKSVYIKNTLNKLDHSKYSSIEIGFSAQTSCTQTQDIIDGKMDKRKRGYFGPKVGKCVLFVDDLNMPQKETYGAQPPIEILRQYLDQGGWYDNKDKEKMFKNFVDTTLVAAMGPPGGGRTYITPRILRHFTLTSLVDFDSDTLNRIFGTILDWFLKTKQFSSDVQKMSHKIIHATQEIYKTAVTEMLPTPIKSHYLFNLRDFAKVIFGVCMADKEKVQTPEDIARLWLHETWRIFGDRLINDDDRQQLLDHASQIVTRFLGLNFNNVFQHLDIPDKDGNYDQVINQIDEIRNLIWTDIMTPMGAQKRYYEEIRDYPGLQQNIENHLNNYNMMSETPMNLVMFKFAVEHLLIISRILKTPGGNALLVGVGGSGRQSLTKLSSHIMDYSVFQIEITKLYGTTEWHDDIKAVMKSAGSAKPTVFLFADSQIKMESFVEDINNLLNTCEVPNLFTAEERAEIQEIVRNVQKNLGQNQEGTPAQMHQYFIQKVQENLHIVLAFSPIGDAFRTRVRMFPSLVNCCTIDWFSEWPEDALHSVATKFIQDIPLQDEIKLSCIDLLKYFHSQTIIQSKEFFLRLKRKYYVTPTSYIEMIILFKTLLDQKRTKVTNDETKYVNGYDKIIETEKTISEMQVVIEDMIPQLKKAQEDTEVKMVEVEQQKKEADKMEEVITQEQEVVQVAVNDANIIKTECEKALSEAMPALLAAENALKVLERKDIDVLKTMRNPPMPIKVTMQALCLILYPNPTEKKKNPDTLKVEVDWWQASMKLLNNNRLLQELIEYDKENIEEKIIVNLGKFLNDPDNQKMLDIKVIENASQACKCIIQWIKGIYNFYFVNKKVKPKKLALKESNAKVKSLNQELQKKQIELKKATDKVDALNLELEATTNNKLRLETQYNDYTAQLERAKLLIESLGGEKGRWFDLGQSLKEDFKKLTGDIIVSAGMIAYLGAFTQAFRSKIQDDWVQECQQKEIPSSETFSLSKILGDPVKIREWNIQGLPSDDFSVQNSIIAFTSRRWPLFIDPQGQANKWIKKMEGKRQLSIIKLSDGDYLRTLENAIQFGNPVLLENVGEELDPALSPILLKQTFKKGNTVYLKLGDQLLEYSDTFKFYITTKYRNPHYLPETSTTVTLINFMITYEGLNDQLLGILVQKEKPELEQEKERLILESAENKKSLFEIEEQILQVLQESKNILTDDKAINILTASKEKSNAITEQQKVAEVTEKEIDSARQQYLSASQEASCLFFAISDLVSIDPMYQYSLTYYIDLFSNAIENSDKSIDLEQRLNNLKQYFLYSLYSNICRSLFEKDKLLLSFLLCSRILEFKKEISNEDYRFLLTGGLGMDEELPEKPDIDWLNPKMWGEICRLSKIPGYSDLPQSFETSKQEWQQIFESAEPHKLPLPASILDKFNSFQKLCILRTIRIDKLIPQITDFIVEKLGKKFVEPPPFDLAKIYKDSTSLSPLIFILSPGSDPFVSLNNFSQIKKQEITPISLGQGQGPAASKLISEGQISGSWVVLQNCHLAVSWMPTLEKIVEEFNHENTHEDFRLWLTSYPSDKFPTSILQGGVKMTTEAPKGLKSNLIGSYLTDPINKPDFFDSCNQPQYLKRLCFGLCFFHAVIQERRKYGSLGWNIPYEFNESDLRISVRQLHMFLDEVEDNVIPFDALKYLTGECNYGGRVTDDKDRLLLNTLLEDYYNKSVAKQANYKFSTDDKYMIPDCQTFDQFIGYIKQLPIHPNPQIYGFHQNADITKDINETNLLLNSLLSTNQEGANTEGQSPDDTLKQLVENIQIQPEYDLETIQKNFPVLYEESMNTVLIQELTRYNKLIKVIRSSIKDMGLALQGKILMSQELENASRSMLDGKVPNLWMAKSYPSLKPLGAYVKDLKQRLAFFDEWIENGIPVNFWISGFYFTQSFLTGVLQNFARKYEISIDEIAFDFEIQDGDPQEKPQDGAYIWGLFIEGANWDYAQKELTESDPKVLFVKCPVIQLIPSQVDDLKKYKHYNCPVYKTSARRGVLSTTGHSTNFVMKMKLPSSIEDRHWIKRGVALLTQLDD